MADRKITDLTALAAGSQATGDLVTIVDVSESAAADKNKKMTMENLFKGIPGDVGIGTATPGAKLSIAEQTYIDGGFIRFLSNASSQTGTAMWRPATDTLAFNTNSTERFRIDSDGRLLVGTSSARTINSFTPSLQVEGATADTASITVIRHSAGTGGSRLLFAKSRGSTIGSTALVSSGDPLGEIAFAGADGTDFANLGGSIKCLVDGTPGSNDMPGRLVFFTTADNASSPTERMRIDSSGNVATGEPTNVLTSQLTSGKYLAVVDTTNGGQLVVRGQSPKLFFDCTSSGDGEIYMDAGNLKFIAGSPATVTGERARIDSSGRLLVGSSSSRANGYGDNGFLQLEGTSYPNAAISTILNSANANGPSLNFAKTRGTSNGSSTVVQNGDNLGVINFAGGDGTDIKSAGARIRAQVDGTASGNDMPGRLSFETTPDGSVSPIERMRITNGGNIGIGSTSPQSFGLFVVRNTDSRYTAIESSGKLVARYDDNSGSHFNILVRNTGITAVGHSANIGFYLGQSGTAKNGGIISSVAESNYSTDAHADAALVFSSASNNSNNEVFRITSDKYLRMNSTTGGIQFNNDTAAANALDDYEEGTFTPTMDVSGTSGTLSISYSSQTGRYIKVGRTLFFTIDIRLSGFSRGTGTGGIVVGSLPYMPADTSNFARANGFASLYDWNYSSTAADIPVFSVRQTGAQSFMDIKIHRLNNTDADINDPDNNSMVFLTGTYETVS